MEFGLSEMQLALQENLRRFLEQQCTLEQVRELATEDAPFPPDMWRDLAQLGITGATIPESFGGSGLETLDAVAISECLGYFVAPVPFLASAVIGPQALLCAGSDRQCAEYLPKLAAGELTVGLAISEVPGARSRAGVTAANAKLNGKAMFTMDPASDLLLVADRHNGMHLVTPSSGVSLKPMPQIDRTRRLGMLELQSAPAELLPGSTDSDIALQLIDLARLIIAADTLGAAQSMLDQAVEYAKQREQFNRPIGSFQAVKHMCAEMAAEIEPARALLWYAGHAYDHILSEARLLACHAKAHLAEVGTFIGRTATVVHGGMGFTDLLGLHYWFKRLGFNRQIFGGPELVREEAAKTQGLVA